MSAQFYFHIKNCGVRLKNKRDLENYSHIKKNLLDLEMTMITKYGVKVNVTVGRVFGRV